MKEYDVYVPRNYNDGSPVERAKLRAIKRRLAEEFRGVTELRLRKKGWWRLGKALFRDKITIFRVYSDHTRTARRFLRLLKAELKVDLRQKEILIVERDARVL